MFYTLMELDEERLPWRRVHRAIEFRALSNGAPDRDDNIAGQLFFLLCRPLVSAGPIDCYGWQRRIDLIARRSTDEGFSLVSQRHH